jgi:two-component system chemotaxis response regulator CheY
VQVLIIDDDVVSRMVLMHLVDSAGAFDILEAEDGEDAWGQLQGGARPAIVFCDLRMPRLSGMELLARVKADARFAGLPFVLVSAAGDAATMEQALGLGAGGYIVKPFDSAKVCTYLGRLCAGGGIDPDEPPDATMRRLGIDAARLLLYLGGLQRQLAGAGDDIAQLLAGGQADAARAQLARLREGCATLGLHAAAAGFDTPQGDAVPGLERMRAALDGAQAAVLRQTQAVVALRTILRRHLDMLCILGLSGRGHLWFPSSPLRLPMYKPASSAARGRRLMSTCALPTSPSSTLPHA